MNEHVAIKRILIAQSLSPLFLIVLIKNFDQSVIFEIVKNLEISSLINCENIPLVINQMKNIIIHVWENESFLPLFIIEGIGIFIIIYSLVGIMKIRISEKNGFISQGEALKKISKKQDSGLEFFMTYIIPLTTEKLETWNGCIVFCLTIFMLLVLLSRTNFYFKNPILTILGYNVYFFEFEKTQDYDFSDKTCVAITRGELHEKKTIKRKLISDNVFLIYEK